jgi:phenylacetate-CoA ligase
LSLISLMDSVPFGNRAEKGYFLYKHAPHSILDKLQADNFKKTVEFVAAHSPFYKRKFAEKGIDPKKVRAPEDLGDFFTTAEDIRANVEEFVCMRPDTAYETTGTLSKKTKRVYFSRQEVKEAGWAGAVGLWALGVRPEDRVVSAFDYSFWVSGPVLVASCEVLGCFHVEAGRLDPEEFYDRLKDYGVTVIVGDPSWIVRLSEIAEKKGVRHQGSGEQAWPVKLLLGGGENLTEEARRYVEKVWKADFLLSYGQTEAFGAIGMESRDKQGYHLNEFHNRFEIVNADADGYGELVYTTVNRRTMPLVRYRSGDVTKFLEGNTKSGLPGRRIAKLRGRIDEWTVTAMGNIAPWMFEPFFAEIAGIGPDWQVVVEKDGKKDVVSFHVEKTDGADETALKAKTLSVFKIRFPESWRVSEMGLLKVDVAVHTAGTLRTGRKLRRIMDKRVF